MRKHAALALVLSPLLSPATEDATRVAAQEFRHRVFEARDLAAIEELCSESMRFVDPTAAIWGIPLARGIEGRDVIARTMAGFDLKTLRFDVAREFTAGPYSCAFGAITTIGAKVPMEDGGFFQVLKVEDGLVVERTDYGDYDDLIREDRRIDGFQDDLSHPVVAVSNEFVAAYGEADLDTMDAMLADDAVFHDPTAVVVGGGQPVHGREAILARKRTSFASVKDFRFDVDARFYFDEHAVFAGTCSYALPGRSLGLAREWAEFGELGLVVIVQVRNEEVVAHTDYSDYDGFARQLLAMRAYEPGAKEN